MASISHSIFEACKLLANTSDSAQLDAQVLLCHVLQCNTAYLATWPEKELNTETNATFNALIHKRLNGTPVAYLTGEREFWSLKFNVSEDTLIPRPETELLIETLLEKFQQKNPLDIVDLGTGSGAIAIALASEKPQWELTATDISEETLKVAIGNAKQHGINNITFIHSDWFQSLGQATI